MHYLGHLQKKVLSLEEAYHLASKLKEEGKKIVFTNGCFDIIHPGHVKLLFEAKSSGDVLFVGLNSDTSARRLKGEGRPIMGEDERAYILAALKPVDFIIIFDEDTPIQIIEKILPDVLVKGADWPEDEIVGANIVKSGGGMVVRVELLEGISTTSIIDRIKNLKFFQDC